MHVVTGGAYNGKSAWVKAHYHLDVRDHHWISAYEDNEWPDDLSFLKKSTVVLEGVEQWVYQWIGTSGETDCRDLGRKLISRWHDWEQSAPDRQLIVIGSDISKGIVPIEQKMRCWRDVTGWFYQDLAAACDRMDLVWYGISKRLK